MSNEIIDILLFTGLGLYIMSALMFLFLFLRTFWTHDGIGLVFLKILTFSLFIGSTAIAFARFASLYMDGWTIDLSRAIAIINPITLLGVGLYLNFLFHQKYKK